MVLAVLQDRQQVSRSMCMRERERESESKCVKGGTERERERERAKVCEGGIVCLCLSMSTMQLASLHSLIFAVTPLLQT